MEAVRFNVKLGGSPLLPAAEAGENLSTWFSGNLYDDGAPTIEHTEDNHVLATKLLESLESPEQSEDFADFGWMEAPMDLELFEQSLTPLLDDSLLVNPSTPEAYSHNQVSQSNVKPDEHLYDTLELMLKQLQDEQVGSGSSSPELFPSLSAALVANPSHQLDSVGSVSIADPPADAAADVAADVASDLLDALIQGKMEESASLSELADIAFEWMEMSIPPETPSTPSSLEDSVQSPACSGSPSTTDTESSQYSGEWEEAPKKPARSSRYSRSSKPSEPPAAGLKASGRGRGRRTRIPPEDRLLRKKEQNKTAATRYREKKKMELGVVHEQEMELEKQNRKLQQEHDSLVQELHFMKKLMRDVFRKTSSSR